MVLGTNQLIDTRFVGLNDQSFGLRVAFNFILGPPDRLNGGFIQPNPNLTISGVQNGPSTSKRLLSNSIQRT